MGDWTGTVPSFPVGNLRSADMTTLADIDTALVTAWTTWSPTLTNLTLGNGTISAVYRRTGKTLDYDFLFTLGTTSAVGTDPTFTLPATPAAHYTGANFTTSMGQGQLVDASGGVSRPVVTFWSSTKVAFYFLNATPTHASITATAPWTWAVSDTLHVFGRLETT